MNFNDIRKKQLMENIHLQYKLLNEYEKKRDLSDRPKEIELFNDEVIRITQSLNDYIIEINQIYKGDNITTPQEVASIWNELQNLKKGQKEIIGKQDETLTVIDQTRNALLEETTAVYQNTMRIFLLALNEQDIHIVQAVVEYIDQKQFTEVEMIEILKVIQKGYNELQDKTIIISTDDAVLQQTQKLSEAWKSSEINTDEKLKLSIPIVPTILTYEAELSINVKETLRGFWEKFWMNR